MSEQTKYHGAWVLLLFFVFGAALALVWMLAEVRRTKHIHDLSYPPAPAQVQTNRT
jgi:hypothetical protein